jgi:hypothetical protein
MVDTLGFLEAVGEGRRKFGVHRKAGGWRLGLLVARSCESGEGTGDNQFKVGVRNPDHDKISFAAFAPLSEVQPGSTHSHALEKMLGDRRALAGAA